MKLIKRILPLSERGFSSLRLGIAANVLRELCAFLPFVIIWRLINIALDPVVSGAAPDLSGLRELGFIGIGVVALTLLAYWLSERANNIPTYHEMDRMRRAAARRLVDMPMSLLNAQSSGDLISNIMADCANCETVMSGLVPGLIARIIASLIIFCVLACIDWRMSLAAFGVVPVSFLIQALSLRLQARLTRQQLKAKSLANNTILEYIAGMPVIKSYHLSEETFEKLAADLDAVRKISTRLELTAGIFVSGAEVVLQLGIGIAILAGSALFTRAQLSLTTMLLFFSVVLRIYEPLARALGDLSALCYMSQSLRRLRELFALPVDSRPGGTLERFDLCFSHVWFRYFSFGHDVLRGLSFTVPEGSITAIVGPSGEGKSTTLRLLSQLWEPTKGAIFVGGTDISTLSSESYYRYLSVVSQDVVLFNDTLMNNIRVGKPGASKDEIIAAAEAAQCGEFIKRLENGYDTVLAENGQSLSGGERQRISIARAILKDAPILLLDEATASLDPENEALVQAAISKLVQRGKTVLVVAHRLKSVADADQILVIENGAVTQRGTHKKLINQEGSYKRLYTLQERSGNWTAGT